MKHTPHPALAVGALALGLFALPANAATSILINENFDSIANNTDLNSAGWYYRHASVSTAYWPGPAAYSNGTMSGNVLRGGTGSSENAWVLTQWDRTTLTNVGDSLSVTFDMRLTNAHRFNVSFFDAEGTSITANSNSGTTNVIAGSTGYGYEQLFTSQTLTTSGIITTTVANTGHDASVFKTSLTPTLTGEVMTLTFSVTLVETGAQVSLLRGATVLDQWIDTSVVGSISFDTLKFGLSTKVSAIDTRALDNVVLSYTAAIPEPSSAAALAGLATLGLGATRRRRSK